MNNSEQFWTILISVSVIENPKRRKHFWLSVFQLYSINEAMIWLQTKVHRPFLSTELDVE